MKHSQDKLAPVITQEQESTKSSVLNTPVEESLCPGRTAEKRMLRPVIVQVATDRR